MKHVVAAALALAGSFSVPLLGQQSSPREARLTLAAAPQLRFSVDEEFVKLPDNIWPSDAVGVALNSKGHIFLLNRGNHPLLEFNPRRIVRPLHRLQIQLPLRQSDRRRRDGVEPLT